MSYTRVRIAYTRVRIAYTRVRVAYTRVRIAYTRVRIAYRRVSVTRGGGQSLTGHFRPQGHWPLTGNVTHSRASFTHGER